ncbi:MULTISPECIES: DsbA family oxidoreductase [Cellulomonas]|jgi:predicted DsbA family dithiol-disulfide isomerase|uniref:DsbA family oxidoreductase n=1 Tax=Cellulomonas TaxID=1707 RepID=UPI001070AA1E|nr:MULTISPECIES: DsbA family oxidoreductase [Cellulomonas]TFH72551.1 DsbA family oxidoreductase [Cellulomonas sp. HD19AZ1]UCN13285.1 DsbA family oxidoreductase [Cellulomonas iranensis]
MSLDTPVFAAPPRTVTVEVWSDVACPWCFIGKRRFATALRDFPHAEHVEVVWRSYQLSPDTPTGPGRPEVDALVEMKGLPRDQVQQMFGHVTDVAAGEGLRYDFDRTLAFNTFDAHRLLHLARRAGGAALVEATMEALFSAHFEQGVDLGADGALVRIAAQAGFGDHGWSDERVATALAGDDAADEVRADLDEARALRVTGVPFFVVDRKYAVSGAQPAEVFTQLLDAGWREANPLTAAPSAEACTDGSC